MERFVALGEAYISMGWTVVKMGFVTILVLLLLMTVGALVRIAWEFLAYLFLPPKKKMYVKGDLLDDE